MKVLLKVYAKCIDGRDSACFNRLDRAFKGNGS
jgi:hypothetical protein